jgi:hypothetical protein
MKKPDEIDELYWEDVDESYIHATRRSRILPYKWYKILVTSDIIVITVFTILGMYFNEHNGWILWGIAVIYGTFWARTHISKLLKVRELIAQGHKL